MTLIFMICGILKPSNIHNEIGNHELTFLHLHVVFELYRKKNLFQLKDERTQTHKLLSLPV